jgi:hypothetical protein
LGEVGQRPMIVGRLSKTSSGFILSDFAQATLIDRSLDCLQNPFRSGAA